MKISLRWINEFVDVSDYFLKPQGLADVLTKAGLEVEDIQDKAKSLNFVVTGLILEKDKHPQADKLSVCKVTTGEGVVHQIVCGAQNHKSGDRVIVALPGAVLPGNLVIQKALLRQVESSGMLCSWKEIGMDDGSQGIAILPEDTAIGVSVAKMIGADDVLMELKVTPNRADCLSHYGLSREIACLLNRPLKAKSPEFTKALSSSSDYIKVQVTDPELCPRYSARYLENVKVGPSPAWLKNRLENLGLKSINNVVDVTNYVMMELGQPLHAFDASKVQGRSLLVRLSKAGEAFKTLDGTELKLTGAELMIADESQSLCMAGVIGGANSGVSDATTSLILESAYFVPKSVRGSLRRFGVSTDSGYRFSRGVDPSITTLALDAATELILKVAGGSCSSEPVDIYPFPVKKTEIQVSSKTITDRLGYECDDAKLESYLNRLGCQVRTSSEIISKGVFQVLPPTYRFDLETEIDFVEEYARLNGYDLIPETILPIMQAPANHDPHFLLQSEIGRILRGWGGQQQVHSIFSSLSFEEKILGADCDLAAKVPVRVMNPLSEDQAYLRRSILPSLVKNLELNFSRQVSEGFAFEIGKVFCQDADSFPESWSLGLMMFGGVGSEPTFKLKGIVEELLRKTVLDHEVSFQPAKVGIMATFHPGQVAQVQIASRVVGYVGSIHPGLLEEMNVRVPAALAVIDFNVFSKQTIKKVKTPGKYPAVERDLALVMNKDQSVGDVLKEIALVGADLVESVKVFDVYEGEKLGAGLKSVAVKVILQDKKATLQDAVVHETVEKVLAQLRDKYSISLR